MDPVQRYLTRMRAAWGGLSGAYRFLLLALAAVAVITTAALSYISFSADYTPLVTNLSAEDASAITAQLDTANITYRLDAGGTTIQVAKDQFARARVELASHGGPVRGGKGWELFDDVSLGMTPFVQNVNYTRALQSELARSVMQLEPVSTARVIIARGEPSPFIRDQQPATASVVLKLKSGATVSRPMAAGIVSLVARSVEGLKPENVTVVDTTGRLLSDSHAGEPEGMSAGELDHRRDLESYLSSRAEELLARHLGAGRALVRVSADLNYQKMRETKETYINDEKAIKSEQIVSTESGAGGSEPRGVAGAASNIGRGSPVSTSGSSGKTKGETVRNEYLVPRTTQELENRPGAVTRLTVACLVDLSPREGADAGAQTLVSQKEVEDIIKQAVGFKVGRDEIKVTNVPLAGTPPPNEPAEDRNWLDKAQSYVHLVRNVSVMVAFVFLAGTVFMLARRLPAANRAAATTPAPEAGAAANNVDQQRFVEMAGADPQHIARVMAALLRNGTGA